MNATTTPTDEKATQRVERNRRIVALHAEGKSEREIARELGCSRTTVWTVLQVAKGLEA
ncbi:MAG TPA: helix-turn-helix domain-containing protein [Candidatus Limnocylindrales bacterium]|nr:helix-turn-helix domain-containing protein [Candidatus Limnocylindrales bacterium]